MDKNEELLICSKKIDSRFLILVITNIETITSGMLFYGEPFKFWQNAISYLGTTITVNRYHNKTTFVIFATGHGIQRHYNV